jgi:hypothetical protein
LLWTQQTCIASRRAAVESSRRSPEHAAPCGQPERADGVALGSAGAVRRQPVPKDRSG